MEETIEAVKLRFHNGMNYILNDDVLPPAPPSQLHIDEINARGA